MEANPGAFVRLGFVQWNLRAELVLRLGFKRS